jgi:ligand-binding SRPBCC domain-containing protein
MEIIRLTTWIHAPAEQCFRLATSAEFYATLAGSSKNAALQAGAPHRDLTLGERLNWPGRYLGLKLGYTTRITLLRPPCYFCEVLDEGPFRHFEHDHHFTPLNEGTRLRDEMRFLPLPGVLGPMTVPLVRRYLVSRILSRNRLLKSAAEFKGQRHPASEQETNEQHSESSSTSTQSPTGEMLTHRS